MFKSLSLLPKKLFAVVAVAAIVAGISAHALAGFGPDRQTKAWSPTVEGFDHVQFNSFTGVTGVGDERDFLRGVQVGRDGTWMDPVNGVSQDAEVEAKVYIHNNADATLNDQPGNPGVAKNVTVRVALPTGSKQSQQVTSYIKADNANPGEISDTLDMTGENSGFFELAFVPGSAKWSHDGAVVALSPAQEAALISTGVNLGDQKGCFQYVQEVTFRMKVKMPHYTVQKTVRMDGQTANDWKEAVDVKRGQTVEWKVEFDNVGKTVLNDVAILDQLPPFMTVVPGSVKLIDGNNPNGYVFDESAVQNNGTQINVNVGNVNPGINSIIAFKTKINDAKELQCGTHMLYNTAYATPKDYSAVSDVAQVYVKNDTTCAQPSYICKAITVTKLGDRKVRVDVAPEVTGNAKVKTVEYNYGDGTTPKITDKLSDEHQYASDSTYKISVKLNFTVDGQDKNGITSEACTQSVTFTSTPTPPTVLPNTGAGDVLGIFAATTIAGAAAHKLFTRRLNRA